MSQVAVALEYVELARRHPPRAVAVLKAHFFKMLFMALELHKDMRERLGSALDAEGVFARGSHSACMLLCACIQCAHGSMHCVPCRSLPRCVRFAPGRRRRQQTTRMAHCAAGETWDLPLDSLCLDSTCLGLAFGLALDLRCLALPSLDSTRLDTDLTRFDSFDST